MGLLQSLFGSNTPRALVRAAKAGDLTKVQQLLDAGVSADARAEGVFPLFGAAFYGHLDVVRLLRARGAALDVMVDQDTTALHALAQLDASTSMCAALLEGATDVDKNANGATPLMLACQFNRQPMAEALLEHGADVNATFPRSMVVEPFPGDLKGFTPLLFALQNGHDALVPLLLDAGAWLGAALAHGVTELMVAVGASGVAAVNALIAAGADPNARLTKGPLADTTVLMMACVIPTEQMLQRLPAAELALFYANRLNVIRALVEAGADREVTTREGKSARTLAEHSGLMKLAPDVFG